MRKAAQKRRTRETRIDLRLALDGTGKADVRLPEKWFVHMLESLARFGRFDLTVRAGGDFAHHVVEDTAITLGRAFRQAIEGRPVARVGSAAVAMDDALVLAAVDLVDRPYCEVQVPDEMLAHALRSFAMEARLTLHTVILRGRNFHHLCEATFKALGLALRQAVEPAPGLVSTKGRVRWKR